MAKSDLTFLQELERLQRKEERETRNRELSDEEDEDEIPVLVPIPEQVMGWEQNVGLLVVIIFCGLHSFLHSVKVIFQTNKTSRFATMVVATFSLLTVIALAAAMIMTPYSAWVRLDIN